MTTMDTARAGQVKEGQKLYDYFGDIAVQCPLPMVAYHNPGPGACRPS